MPFINVSPFLLDVTMNICSLFNRYSIELSFWVYMERIRCRVSFVGDTHLKSRYEYVVFFIRTLCTLQLCGIWARSIYINMQSTSSSSSRRVSNEKFERTPIPELICLCLCIGDRAWMITFTFSNVGCERYLAPKRQVALTSFVGRDALSQPRWSFYRRRFIHDDSGMTSAYCETCGRFSRELPRLSVISRMNQMPYSYFYDARCAPSCRYSLIDS